MTFRRTWQGVIFHAPYGKVEEMSDCSTRAFDAQRGIFGEVGWDTCDPSPIQYARFVNGVERKAKHIKLDGVYYLPERTCENHSKQQVNQFVCSECAVELNLKEPPVVFDKRLDGYVDGMLNYCPNCGARVKGGGE